MCLELIEDEDLEFYDEIQQCIFCKEDIYFDDGYIFQCSECMEYFCVTCFENLTGKSAIPELFESLEPKCPNCQGK